MCQECWRALVESSYDCQWRRDPTSRGRHSWPSQLNLRKFVTLHWANNIYHMLVVAFLMLIVYLVTLLCILPLVGYPQQHVESVDLLSQNDVHWSMLSVVKRLQFNHFLKHTSYAHNFRHHVYNNCRMIVLSVEVTELTEKQLALPNVWRLSELFHTAGVHLQRLDRLTIEA